MNSRRFQILIVVAVVAVAGWNHWLRCVSLQPQHRPVRDWVQAVDKRAKDKRVEKLMEKLHEGRKSPYRRLKSLVAADVPAWKEVAEHLPRFGEMAEALAKSGVEDIRSSSDGYVAAVKALGEATTKQNADGLRKAMDSLATSCGDCHYKGGPGGKLD